MKRWPKALFIIALGLAVLAAVLGGMGNEPGVMIAAAIVAIVILAAYLVARKSLIRNQGSPRDFHS